MAMTVAALKRRITVGTRITMTQHWLNDCQSPRARPLPVTRAVVKVQGNAIVFEAWPGDDPSKVSWLYWPVAPGIRFLDDDTFEVLKEDDTPGMTYRIER